MDQSQLTTDLGQPVNEPEVDASVVDVDATKNAADLDVGPMKMPKGGRI